MPPDHRARGAVSIHAPRAEGDLGRQVLPQSLRVSIHAPRAEGDRSPRDTFPGGSCFNPRPPRGGRHPRVRFTLPSGDVSIHAPRAEGDPRREEPYGPSLSFNPRPPRGGRPTDRAANGTIRVVSIHAPRAEGDPPRSAGFRGRTRFNPRPPRGGRPARSAGTGGRRRFQSTPPARRATGGPIFGRERAPVSIHAPRAEGDATAPPSRWSPDSFNPRPPRGGRLPVGDDGNRITWFQSTPPARRATRGGTSAARPAGCFNPRPPRGGRLARAADPPFHPHVSIHAPRAEGDIPPAQHEGLRGGFNPRPPRGGRLARWPPREPPRSFNPRPPRGGRLEGVTDPHGVDVVSIHAPRAEGDLTGRGPA